MMVTGDLGHLLQAGYLAEDPHRQIGMQAHPLELAGVNGPGLDQIWFDTPIRPEIVDVAGAAGQRDRVRVQAAPPRRHHRPVVPPLANGQG